MVDAARLASPTGEGSILWHPSSLADIYDVPSRTLILFDFYRLGMATRQHPWSWWRVKDKRVVAHQYMTDWRLQPLSPARCGVTVEGELERHEVSKCSRCERLDHNQVEQATGTIDGVRVGWSGDDPGSGQGQA